MRLAIRYFLLCSVALALGIIPAYLYYRYELKIHNEEFYSDQWSQSKEGVVGAMLSTVGLPAHDFGIIDPARDYSREFILENRGDKTLEIWREAQPEEIVKTDLGPEKILIVAGSSYPIKVSFAGKDVGSELDASVKIQSNDTRYLPDGFEIKLTGRINN